MAHNTPMGSGRAVKVARKQITKALQKKKKDLQNAGPSVRKRKLSNRPFFPEPPTVSFRKKKR